MQRTKWLALALGAGWMGLAAAQGGGKPSSSTAGTEPSPRTDMRTGMPGSETGSKSEESSANTSPEATNGKATTLAKLHAGHDAEIQAGSWMTQHATNSKVKDFAKKMVHDHGAMDKDLQSYAQKHDLALTGVASVDSEKAEHQKMLDELKTMQGAQADRHYMQMMVQDHTKDVSEVKTAVQEAKQGSDKEYTKLLENTEKKMEGHLKDAQKISRDLGARQARNPAAQ